MPQPAFHRIPGTPPLIIAHRGLSSRAPENTLAAFRLAIEARADMIELDVHLSADERVVVIHDRTLQRTTTGNGPVRSYGLAELKTLDAGSWFDPEFSSERIPTLDEVLKLARDRCRVNIEMKSHAFHREPAGKFERRVLDVIEEHHMTDHVLISSFDHDLIRGVRKLDSNIQTGVLFNWHSRFQTGAIDMIGGGTANIAICSRGQLNAFLSMKPEFPGCSLFAYVINDPKEAARLATFPVDGLITDSPDILLDRFGVMH